jgi:predicted glutamine amidotransferase
MCGLVGVAGNLAFKDEATMKRLFLLDYFRGPDSTGFAGIRTNGEAKIAKLSSNPIDLFDMAKFKDALNGPASKVFMGHNRAATKGAVTSANAHPYQYGHIIGAHNGTLDLASVSTLETMLGEKFAVDSQALFAAIAQFGIEATITAINEGRDYQTGAWSLTWYDQNDGSLNFLRNKHRPMWYAYNEEFDRLFWASEWLMIDNAVRMSGGYELWKNEGGHSFFATEENTHYKFDTNLLIAGSKDRPKAKAKVIKGKEPAPVVSAGVHNPFNRTHTPVTTTLTPLGKTTPSRSNSSGKTNIIHLLGDVNSPMAGYIKPERFMELAKYGCSFCQCDVEYGDVGLTIFERDDILLCADCSDHNDGKPNAIPATRVYVPGSVLEGMK